jgi:hypothetical protein
MPAPQYNEPKSLDDARRLRLELLEVVKKIKIQLSYKSRQNKDTGLQMTPEEFERWKTGAKTALNAATRDLNKVEFWIKDDLLRRAPKLLIELDQDVGLNHPDEIALIGELKTHTGVQEI